MYDLIYADQLARERLQKIYPHATFENASDFIHEERFSIEVDVEIGAYRLVLLEEGLALESLNFQMWMRTRPDECKAMVEKWKQLQRERNLTNPEDHV